MDGVRQNVSYVVILFKPLFYWYIEASSTHIIIGGKVQSALELAPVGGAVAREWNFVVCESACWLRNVLCAKLLWILSRY